MNTYYLEYKDNRSNKFYEITLDLQEVRMNFGKIGKTGQLQKRQFKNNDKAKIFYDRKIRQKINKGYLIAEKIEYIPQPKIEKVEKIERQLRIPYKNFKY